MGIKTGLPDTDAQYDLCVVGAGPIGLSVAMEATEQGLSVLVLESGGMTPLGSAAVPTYGDVIDEKRHSPLDVAHDRVDRALRASGLGYLDYHVAPEQRVAAVLEQAMDGFHQEGLMRMGTDPANSVVDADCRVHDFDNLFIASTGVFPTSGQANPTFSSLVRVAQMARR